MNVSDVTMTSAVEQDFYLYGQRSTFTDITTQFNGNGFFHFTGTDNSIDDWTITNTSTDANHRLVFYLNANSSNYPIIQYDIFEKYDDFSNPELLESLRYPVSITINGLNYTTGDSEPAEINLIGGNITGNILHTDYDDVLNLYNAIWKPDTNFVDTVSSAADINFRLLTSIFEKIMVNGNEIQ